MKKVLFYILMYSIFTASFAQNSIEEIADNNSQVVIDSTKFHISFQKAFTNVLVFANNDFENVNYDTTEIKLDDITYSKIMLDFPQAEYSLYRKSLIPDMTDKYKHTLKIYYDTSKHKDDIFLDNDIYNDIYTEVINEFEAIHKVELGGKWKMSVNSSGIKMLLDEDPSLKIYVKPSGKTGFEIEFDLTED